MDNTVILCMGVLSGIGVGMMPITVILIGHYTRLYNYNITRGAIIAFLATWAIMSPLYGLAWIIYITVAAGKIITEGL